MINITLNGVTYNIPTQGEKGWADTLNAFLTALGSNGIIYTNVASVGNGADTTEDTLMSFSFPSGTLKAGDVLEINAWGTGVNTANATTVRAYFGATQLTGPVTSVLYPSQANTWHLRTQIIVKNATSQVALTELLSGTDAGVWQVGPPENTSPAEAISGAILFKCTGQRGTSAVANSVTQLSLTIRKN